MNASYYIVTPVVDFDHTVVHSRNTNADTNGGSRGRTGRAAYIPVLRGSQEYAPLLLSVTTYPSFSSRPPLHYVFFVTVQARSYLIECALWSEMQQHSLRDSLKCKKVEVIFFVEKHKAHRKEKRRSTYPVHQSRQTESGRSAQL